MSMTTNSSTGWNHTSRRVNKCSTISTMSPACGASRCRDWQPASALVGYPPTPGVNPVRRVAHTPRFTLTTPTYAEIRQKTIDNASAIKDVNPNAMVFGGVGYGWSDFHSLQGGTMIRPSLYNRILVATRPTDLDSTTILLQQVHAAEVSQGRKLMDVARSALVSRSPGSRQKWRVTKDYVRPNPTKTIQACRRPACKRLARYGTLPITKRAGSRTAVVEGRLNCPEFSATSPISTPARRSA